jgi:hypothetical protein
MTSKRSLGAILIAAGRDAEKIDDRYSVLERLAIGRLRPETDQSNLSHV